MKKLVAIFIFFLSAAVLAAEVDLSAARRFAQGWRGRAVKDGRTVCDDKGASRFHVVTFSGGGWAAVGADDTETPVIAFSDNGEDLVEDESNPVWFLVRRDAERRAVQRGNERKAGGKAHRKRHKGWDRAERNASGENATGEGESLSLVKTATVTPKTGTSVLSDIRVAPMLASTWNQSDSAKTYNFYTPNNYVCGCVATMTAQLLRYYEWPKTSVKKKVFSCMVGSNVSVASTMSVTNCTMYGGIYDWSKMTPSPTSSTPEANRREIAKLCYDVGVSVNMMWSGTGSGAFLTQAREALKDTWGFKSASCVVYDYPNPDDPDAELSHPYDFEEFKTIVRSNCEAGLPLGYGISGRSGGHAVVIDGYGYSGDDFYIHINPGWGGSANAWYCPPNLSMGGYSFNSSDELVYNIFTTGTGALITGKVTDQHGNPVAGAEVKAYSVAPVRFGLNRLSTNLMATAVSSSDGRYHFKTGTDAALDLYMTATKGSASVSRADETNSSRSMLGNRASPFAGTYYTNGYSLGNKTDVDFRLFIPPFSIHIQ